MTIWGWLLPNAFFYSPRFFGFQLVASPPFEAVRIGIRFAFQDIRSDFADQRSELEGVAAAAGAHQQPGMFRILADPEIPIEGIAVET